MARARPHWPGLPCLAAPAARCAALTEALVQAQRRIEAADSEPFEDFRQAYVLAERLNLRQGESATSAAAAASAVAA